MRRAKPESGSAKTAYPRRVAGATPPAASIGGQPGEISRAVFEHPRHLGAGLRADRRQVEHAGGLQKQIEPVARAAFRWRAPRAATSPLPPAIARGRSRHPRRRVAPRRDRRTRERSTPDPPRRRRPSRRATEALHCVSGLSGSSGLAASRVVHPATRTPSMAAKAQRLVTAPPECRLGCRSRRRARSVRPRPESADASPRG